MLDRWSIRSTAGWAALLATLCVAAPLEAQWRVDARRFDASVRSSSAALALEAPALPGTEVRGIAPRTMPLPADTPAAVLGERAGYAAAGEEPVAGRVAVSFLGGLPIGFFALHGLAQRDPLQVISLAAGASIIGGAVWWGDNAPEAIDAHGADYERAYVDAYSTRLQKRRRWAVLSGALAGAVAGFAILIRMLPYT